MEASHGRDHFRHFSGGWQRGRISRRERRAGDLSHFFTHLAKGGGDGFLFFFSFSCAILVDASVFGARSADQAPIAVDRPPRLSVA